MSKKLLDDEQVEEFLKQHDIDVSLKGHLLETLFITLLQYTGGDVKAMVNALGERGAFQALRWVHHKGTVLDYRQRIELRSKVLSPKKADKVEDVEAKVLLWKKDLNRCDSRRGQDPALLDYSSRDRSGLFVESRLQPERVGRSGSCRGCRRDVFKKGGRLKTGAKNHDGCLNVVTNDSTGHRDLDASELDFPWCDYYGDNVAMKPLNMAVKRQRIETQDGNVNETKENAPNQEVKGGGKKVSVAGKPPQTGAGNAVEITTQANVRM